MAIYSTPVLDVSSRLAAKKKTASKKASAQPVPTPNPVEAAPLEETPQQKRNRLARERRAQQKQALLDQQEGVTLATGKIKPVVKDTAQPVYTPPAEKQVIPRKRKTPPPPPSVDSHPEGPPVNGSASTSTEVALEPISDEEMEKKIRKKKQKKVWNDPTEPPRWYTSLLTDVIKAKIEHDGEKASKKIVKETSEEVAKEKWADPCERERQDKLFNQIFRSMY